MEVKVFSTPTCPYCKMAKTYLDEQGVKFKDFDVTQDAAAKDEMIQKSGQMGVPVITVDGDLVIGFDRERLDSLIKAGN